MVLGLKLVSEKEWVEINEEVYSLDKKLKAANAEIKIATENAKKGYDKVYQRLAAVKKYIKEANPNSRLSTHIDKIMKKAELHRGKK